MSTAYKAGTKVGTAGAWVLSKSFHVACKTASGLGDFGAGMLDEGGQKLTEYNAINERARLANEEAGKVLIAQIRAAHTAKMLALNAPTPAVPVAPATMAAAS